MTDDVRQVLERNRYLTLATVSEDGAPWNTTLHYASDDTSIYWSSSDETVHSQNLAHDQRAFGIVFDTEEQKEAGGRAGVYISSQAKKLDGDERRRALTVYAAKFSAVSTDDETISMYGLLIGLSNTTKTTPRRYYFENKG